MRALLGSSWVVLSRIVRPQIEMITTVILLIRVVVKIMVPFWVLNIIRHLIFRVPQKGP